MSRGATAPVGSAAGRPSLPSFVILTGLLIVAALLVLWLEPPCAWRALTGLDCPTCGATRAARALLAGSPGEALAHHAPTVFVAAQLGLLALGALVLRARRRPIPRPPQSLIDAALIGNGLILLGAWGVRLAVG